MRLVSPLRLNPMVTSKTRKRSYPEERMRARTSEILSDSDNDSLMASPSSLIKRLKLSSSSKIHRASFSGNCMIRFKTVSRCKFLGQLGRDEDRPYFPGSGPDQPVSGFACG